MPRGAVAMCIAAVAIAVCAWLLGSVVVQGKFEAVRRGWSLTPAVVTAVDVTAGKTLALSDLELREIPKQLMTGSLFTDKNALVGRRASIALPRGTPVPAGAVDTLGSCE